MLFARKAGIMGFVGDCAGPTEKVLWITGATSGLDLLMNGEPGSGMSGGGMNLIAVGARGGAFHCFSSSVPLNIAGIEGLRGASITALLFRSPVAVNFSWFRFGAFDRTGDADLLAHIDSDSSQPDDFTVSSNFLDGTFVRLDMSEWSTLAAGGTKNVFRDVALSCAVERSTVSGTLVEELPAVVQVALGLAAASESELVIFPLRDPFAELGPCGFPSDLGALGIMRSLPFDFCGTALASWSSRPTYLIGAGAGDAEAVVDAEAGVGAEAGMDAEAGVDVGGT